MEQHTHTKTHTYTHKHIILKILIVQKKWYFLVPSTIWFHKCFYLGKLFWFSICDEGGGEWGLVVFQLSISKILSRKN